MSQYSALSTAYGAHADFRTLQDQQPHIAHYIKADLSDPDRLSEVYLAMVLFFQEQR